MALSQAGPSLRRCQLSQLRIFLDFTKSALTPARKLQDTLVALLTCKVRVVGWSRNSEIEAGTFVNNLPDLAGSFVYLSECLAAQEADTTSYETWHANYSWSEARSMITQLLER